MRTLTLGPGLPTRPSPVTRHAGAVTHCMLLTMGGEPIIRVGDLVPAATSAGAGPDAPGSSAVIGKLHSGRTYTGKSIPVVFDFTCELCSSLRMYLLEVLGHVCAQG